MQKLETFLNSDTSDIFQNDLYISYDESEIDKYGFEGNPFCNNIDDQSTMFDIKLYKSVKTDDNHYLTARAKSNCDNLHPKSRSLKLLSLNVFPEILDLSVTDTVHGSPTSFANESKSSLPFNHSQPSNRITRTKYNLRPLPRTIN